MANEDKIGTPDDESNVDQINKLITNSKKTESKLEENEVTVEESELNEEEPIEKPQVKEEETKEEPKGAVERKIENKVEHKKTHPAKNSQSTHMTPVKKHEVKKEIIPEKVEHKQVKHEIKNKVIVEKSEYQKEKHRPLSKPENRKIIKEAPQVKKVVTTKKSVKEEKMKNHKEHQKKSEFNKSILMWIGIGALIIILAVALIMMLSTKKTVQPITNQTSNSVAATVNGEPIYLQDVMKEYNNLKPLEQSIYSVESILNKSINILLLYQEAKNNDIQVKAEEVQSAIDATKIRYQLTDTALEEALKGQGLTLDSWKTIIERDLMIEKLLNTTIKRDINVTERQIEAYYEQNIEKFKVPEKVTVQHILILVTPNVTDDIAKAKIDQIQIELNNTNLCELVKKYSEDPGSLETCGKYTFAKGDFQNPEFENPSFDLNVGEMTIVKTVFGYHLIKKLETIPARTMKLSEVKSEIEAAVRNQLTQKKFDELLTQLEAKAEIVNYMAKTDNNETLVPLLPTIKNLDDFAKCISVKNATFYGASWCSHCKNQKEMFGESMQYVNYIDCEVGGKLSTECIAADIQGYPTWIINDKKYTGEQTLANLAKLTGCVLPP